MMKENYFMSITKVCQYEGYPIWRNKFNKLEDFGKVIDKKVYYSPLSEETINKTEKNFENEYNKYISYIHRIKPNVTKKYMVSGYKQAKRIKKYCEKNNISCNIEEDPLLLKNKLKTLCILVDHNGDEFSTEDRDYSQESLRFIKEKQKIIYVKITK